MFSKGDIRHLNCHIIYIYSLLHISIKLIFIIQTNLAVSIATVESLRLLSCSTETPVEYS